MIFLSPGWRQHPSCGFWMCRFLLANILVVAVSCMAFANGKHPGSEASIATIATFNQPAGLTIGPDGALYLCEVGNHVIERLDLKTGKSSVVAGQYGKKGYAGDGGPAIEALLNEPFELRFDRNGDLYFVEIQNFIVRKVDHKTKLISTIAGTGTSGFSGDGAPAIKAQFGQPHSLALDNSGGLLICDVRNNRIRRLDLKTGIVETYAGTGEKKPTPDGALIQGTPLNGPRSLDLDRAGNIYVVLREGNAVVKIIPKENRIVHLAGTGEKGYSGNGGPALQATFSGPKGIAVAGDGSVYIADTENHAIRRIDPKTGILNTVAGTGERGDGPEGDPAKCKLSRPHGIYIDRNGSVFIGDTEGNKVRRIK